MRSRHLLATLLLPTVTLGMTACAAGDDGDPGAGGGGAGPEVVVSAYPLQFIAEHVVGDAGTVTSVAPAGTEPHDLELSPSGVASLTSADVVLYLSDFQAAVDDAVAEAGSGTVVLDAAEWADLLTTEEEHGDEEHAEEDEHAEDEHAEDEHAEEDEEHGHDHGGVDPHFWLDPARVADVADGLAAALAETDPNSADVYTANASALRAELEQLDSELAEGLSSCEQRSFVTSHEAFGYLAEAFELEQIGISGLDPEAEPSPARIADVLADAREAGVTTVFNEPGGIVAGAEEIAAELGVTLATLNPIELEPSEELGSDYLGAMRTNLDALREGLMCQ